MSFLRMLRKELKELARSYKLLFVPLAIAMLAVMQPVTIKLMPMILANAGNMPEGTVIRIPEIPTWQVMRGVIDQYNQLGLLILVLVAMSTIAGERGSGVAATVLTKPVGRGAYLSAKAVSYSLLALLSLVVGMALSAYYTELLLGPVSWAGVRNASLIYMPNLLLAVAVTVCYSAFLPSSLATAGAGITTLILLNTVPRYMGDFLRQTYPGALTAATGPALFGQPFEAWPALVGTMALALAFLAGGWLALRRMEM